MLVIALAAVDAWSFAGLMALVGLGVFLATHAATRKHAPEKMRPVLEAVRDAPERVTLLHHYETSGSYGTFATHWVLIRTADGHLLVNAPHDWQELLAMLQRRCPNAKVTTSDRRRGARPRYFVVTTPPTRSARLIDASFSLAVNCVSSCVLYAG